jgi:hypothetical protein
MSRKGKWVFLIKKRDGIYAHCIHYEVLLSGSMSGSSAYTPKRKSYVV